MELQVLLNEYEFLVKSAVSLSAGEMRDIRERRAWVVYRFLVRCGVDPI